MLHAGTCGSSATKKLYRWREMKRAVAGCLTMMRTMSSPLKLPVSPRKVFSPSSWSSARKTNDDGLQPFGYSGMGCVAVQPVKARAAFLMSCSV